MTINYRLVALVACFALPPVWADPPDTAVLSATACQAKLNDTVPRGYAHRLTLPLVDQKRKLIALTSVITDLDPHRDVVIGVGPGKHTYLINAQIGRHDPGQFGYRGRFHANTAIGRLMVSPGLLIRLRLPVSQFARVTREMERMRRTPSITCTNTIARILAGAGVTGLSPFVLTPVQMLRGIRRSDLDARYVLVNSDADSLNDFEDRAKLIGPKKTPPAEDEATRRTHSASCDGEDWFNCCTIASLDFDWCAASSPTSESGCSESNCSECGACESGDSDCGGSDCGH